MEIVNKAIQHQPLRGLDSLAVARVVHGYAIVAQHDQQLACRRLRRYRPGLMARFKRNRG